MGAASQQRCFLNAFAPALLLLLTAACSGESATPSEPAAANPPMITQVLREHTDELMAIDDVVAVGESLCDGQPCIRVYLRQENAASRLQIPVEIEGIPVFVEVSGQPKAGL
jgi:hypothetical protein